MSTCQFCSRTKLSYANCCADCWNNPKGPDHTEVPVKKEEPMTPITIPTPDEVILSINTIECDDHMVQKVLKEIITVIKNRYTDKNDVITLSLSGTGSPYGGYWNDPGNQGHVEKAMVLLEQQGWECVWKERSLCFNNKLVVWSKSASYWTKFRARLFLGGL